MPMLTEHFSTEEACITSHRGIDNSIPLELVPAILNTARNMELVRSVLGKPISINSWYRCPELNAALGSNNTTSQHPKGEAVDFISPQFGSCLQVMRKLIIHSSMILYDQLIYEHSWVHISFQSNPNVRPRNQVLTLLKSGRYAVGLTDSLGKPL